MRCIEWDEVGFYALISVVVVVIGAVLFIAAGYLITVFWGGPLVEVAEMSGWSEEAVARADLWQKRIEANQGGRVIIIGRKNSEEGGGWKHIVLLEDGIRAHYWFVTTFYPYEEVGMVGGW